MAADLSLCAPPSAWCLGAQPFTRPSATASLLLHTRHGVVEVIGTRTSFGDGSSGEVVALVSSVYPHRYCAAKVCRHLHLTHTAFETCLTTVQHQHQQARQEKRCVCAAVVDPSGDPSENTLLGNVCREAALLWSLRCFRASQVGEGEAHTDTPRTPLGARHVVVYYGLAVGHEVAHTSPHASPAPLFDPIFSSLLVLTEYISGGTVSDCVWRYTLQNASHPAPSSPRTTPHTPRALAAVHVVTWFSQALQALAYIHEDHRILHRDVKPANMMIRLNEGHVADTANNEWRRAPLRDDRALDRAELVLIDFGESVSLASPNTTPMVDEACHNNTQHRGGIGGGGGEAMRAAPRSTVSHATIKDTTPTMRTVIGTEGYCAPELATVWGCESRAAYGPAADLWSLAASFYVLLVQGPEACAHGMTALLRTSARQARGCACEDGSGGTASAVSGPLALMITACGAYPSLRALSRQGYPTCKGDRPTPPTPTSTPQREETNVSVRARVPWSWARSRDLEASGFDTSHDSTFFGGPTADHTTTVISESMARTSAMITSGKRPAPASQRFPTDSTLMSTALSTERDEEATTATTAAAGACDDKAAQNWGRQAFAHEQMAAHFRAHHGDAVKSRCASLHAADASTSRLVARQCRVSDLFVDCVDALMSVDPRARPSARLALHRFATLRAYCGVDNSRAAASGIHWADRHRDSAQQAANLTLSEAEVVSEATAHCACAPKTFWEDETLVLSLVLASATSLCDRGQQLWRVLRDASDAIAVDTAISCTALLFRALGASGRHDDGEISPLSTYLNAHRDTLETAHVVLLMVEWMEDVPERDRPSDARDADWATRFGLPHVRGVLEKIAVTSVDEYHVEPPAQALLASTVHVSSCVDTTIASPHAISAPSSADAQLEHGDLVHCLQHCRWYLLYGVSRLTVGPRAPVMLCVRAALQRLSGSCMDAEASLRVVASTLADGDLDHVEVSRAIVVSWSAQLHAAHVLLQSRLDALATSSSEKRVNTQADVDPHVLYLVSPPSAQDVLDALRRTHTEGDAPALGAFVRHWLSHAPYVVTTPC